MNKLMKTRVVSEKIGVHPTTIQRWVKFFDLDWRKNEHGHYLFTADDILFFQEIKQQLVNGLALNEITLPSRDKAKQLGSTEQEELNSKAPHLEQRLALLEASLSQKADDVVSYQVLQQRQELEELAVTLSALEEKIETLEEKLATSHDVNLEVAYEPKLEGLTRASKQTLLRRMFSFFV